MSSRGRERRAGARGGQEAWRATHLAVLLKAFRADPDDLTDSLGRHRYGQARKRLRFVLEGFRRGRCKDATTRREELLPLGPTPP